MITTREEALAFRASIEEAAALLSDERALKNAKMFPRWSKDKDYIVGDRVRDDDDKLYKCYNPISANPTWQPRVTPSHWEVIPDPEETGTLNNPITASAGMTYYKGLYYKESDKIYLCTRDDTGSGTILQYTPSQLIGIYFEEVS